MRAFFYGGARRRLNTYSLAASGGMVAERGLLKPDLARFTGKAIAYDQRYSKTPALLPPRCLNVYLNASCPKLIAMSRRRSFSAVYKCDKRTSSLRMPYPPPTLLLWESVYGGRKGTIFSVHHPGRVALGVHDQMIGQRQSQMGCCIFL